MFIGISFDLATTDSQNSVLKILNEYGIKKTFTNLFESFEFPLKSLGNLKRDLTNSLDMDDKLRLYQYPLEGSFKISYIENGKWKRLSLK
jgi:CRISPR-associated protein Cas2